MENIIEIAADWFEKYLADGNTIDDWCRDSENVESGRERFYREMGFKPLQYYVDMYPLQIVDNIDDVMEKFDFDRAKKAIDALDWKRSMPNGLRLPTKNEIMKEARQLLKEVTIKFDPDDDDNMDYFDTITDYRRIKECYVFKATFCLVDDIIRPQKDDAKWRTQLSLEFTL